MTEPFSRLRRFLRELKRRNVYKVAVTYVAVAFVGLQAVNLLIPATTLPGWADQLFLGLIILGFPVSVVVAWAFEMTAEGMRRTPEAEEESAVGSAYQWLGLALVLALAGGVWYVMAGRTGGPATEATATSADTAARTTSVTRDTAGPPRVAALPFEHKGGEESAQLSLGVHDGLLTRLSNISGLRVISRTSVMQYEDTDKTVPEVAEEVGADWVVEGLVQQAGGQVRINAQLINGRTDVHRWAENYERELTADNLFAIQSELTKKIARSLEAQLTPEETDRVEREPTQSLEAHRLYTQGRRLMLSRQPDSLRRAIGRFEHAIEQDSSYALAWTGLADARLLHAHYSATTETRVDSIAAAVPEAEQAVRRALKLNSDLAEAHASRAILYMYEQSYLDERAKGPVALRHLRRAVKLKPSYAQAHHWLGNLLRGLGRPDRGLKHHRLTVELRPDSYSGQNTFIKSLLASGRYEEARREARRLQDVFPRGGAFTEPEANALFHLKRWGEVRAMAAKHRAETGDPPAWTVFFPALADAAVGDTTAARARIEELHTMGRKYDAALVHATLGELDLAFQKLPEVGTTGFDRVRYFYPDLLSAFREDPRYEKLIRRLNEWWGLNPDGSLPDSVGVSFGSESDD